MHVQSVNELLSKVNYVATRLRHLETIRWHVEWKLSPNELSPKIVLIYALLLLKCRESNLRAFLIHNLNFARLFARLTPVFLLNKRPSFARLFTKMSPSEELVIPRLVYMLEKAPVWRIGYTATHVICLMYNSYMKPYFRYWRVSEALWAINLKDWRRNKVTNFQNSTCPLGSLFEGLTFEIKCLI